MSTNVFVNRRPSVRIRHPAPQKPNITGLSEEHREHAERTKRTKRRPAVPQKDPHSPPAGRQRPRRGEDKARYVYLIKSREGVIKVGISKNVRKRSHHLGNASPDKLSVLKIIKPAGGGGLAFHIESAVKFLLRPFRLHGEWFNCSDAVALLALRAAEHGVLDCHACLAREIERQNTDDSDARWDELTREMCERWPDLMREILNPWLHAQFGLSESGAVANPRPPVRRISICQDCGAQVEAPGRRGPKTKRCAECFRLHHQKRQHAYLQGGFLEDDAERERIWIKCCDCGTLADSSGRRGPRKKRCVECRRARQQQLAGKWRDINSEYNNQWRAANSEKDKAARKLWLKNNPEKRKAYKKRWLAANRERYLETRRQSRVRNRDRINARKRQIAAEETAVMEMFFDAKPPPKFNPRKTEKQRTQARQAWLRYWRNRDAINAMKVKRRQLRRAARQAAIELGLLDPANRGDNGHDAT